MKKITRLKTPAYLTSPKGLLYKIDLFDEIKIETLNERKIQIEKKKGYKIPTNHSNPVFKIASELQKLKPNKFGAKISIQKNIPTLSGLSSKESNAIEVLLVLDELWNFKLAKKELLAIAEKTDEKLAELMSYKNKETRKVILIVPKYIKFRKGWKSAEAFKHFPDLKKIREKLILMGAVESEMSGKGPAIYGLFDRSVSIRAIKKELQGKIDFIWFGKTVNGKINSNK